MSYNAKYQYSPLRRKPKTSSNKIVSPRSIHNLTMLKALGLPETTTSFSIIYEYNSCAKVQCEFYLTEEMLKEIENILNGEDNSTKAIKRLKRMIDKS